MKIDVRSRYKLELISLLLISCCVKVTQDFFIVAKAGFLVRLDFWGDLGSGFKISFEVTAENR